MQRCPTRKADETWAGSNAGSTAGVSMRLDEQRDLLVLHAGPPLPSSILSFPQQCPSPSAAHCGSLPWGAGCSLSPSSYACSLFDKDSLLILQLLDKNRAPKQSASRAVWCSQPRPDVVSQRRAPELTRAQSDFIPSVSSHILPAYGLCFWSCLITPLGLAFKGSI